MTILVISTVDLLALNPELRALIGRHPDIVVVDELPVTLNTHESFTISIPVATNTSSRRSVLGCAACTCRGTCRFCRRPRTPRSPTPGGRTCGRHSKNCLTIKNLLNKLASYPPRRHIGTTMIRARFLTNGEDYRPVNWPIKHPYWCTGFRGDDKAVIVAYADDEAEVLRNWPDATEIDADDVAAYTFTSRFPKPDWLVAPAA